MRCSEGAPHTWRARRRKVEARRPLEAEDERTRIEIADGAETDACPRDGRIARCVRPVPEPAARCSGESLRAARRLAFAHVVNGRDAVDIVGADRQRDLCQLGDRRASSHLDGRDVHRQTRERDTFHIFISSGRNGGIDAAAAQSRMTPTRRCSAAICRKSAGMSASGRRSMIGARAPGQRWLTLRSSGGHRGSRSNGASATSSSPAALDLRAGREGHLLAPARSSRSRSENAETGVPLAIRAISATRSSAVGGLQRAGDPKFTGAGGHAAGCPGSATTSQP